MARASSRPNGATKTAAAPRRRGIATVVTLPSESRWSRATTSRLPQGLPDRLPLSPPGHSHPALPGRSPKNRLHPVRPRGGWPSVAAGPENVPPVPWVKQPPNAAHRAALPAFASKPTGRGASRVRSCHSLRLPMVASAGGWRLMLSDKAIDGVQSRMAGTVPSAAAKPAPPIAQPRPGP